MREYSKIVMIFAFLMLCPYKVFASEHACTNEEKVYWKNLAQNVTVSYDAVTSGDTVKISITFSNLTKDLEIYDLDNQKWYSTSKSEYTITKSKSNETYRFDIYSKDEMCGRVSSYTLYANIPAYNQYQSDPICSGIEDYTLCQKWLNNQYSYEDWKAKVQAYKDSLVVETEDTVTERATSIAEKIVDIYGKVYYIVLPIIIVGGAVIIYVYNKKRELF
jgi:hypothetical protein